MACGGGISKPGVVMPSGGAANEDSGMDGVSVAPGYLGWLLSYGLARVPDHLTPGSQCLSLLPGSVVTFGGHLPALHSACLPTYLPGCGLFT